MQRQPRSASPLLWALALCSFILNILVIGVLIVVYIYGRQVAADLADQLDTFSQQTINYSVHITQTVPVRADVPFSQTMTVPFNVNVPVSTTVKVSKEIPVVGQITFDVPIQTEVPVSLSVPIEISRTLAVNTDVPLSLDVPLQIPLKDTSLKTALDGIIKALNSFAGR